MSRAGRAESVAQALLTVGVGGVAGAAAWSHVVALATAHGQPGWLAWADAAVIETLAVSAGLEIRRRRRGGHPVAAVAAVLVAAVALSLACQVATAEPSPWGWVMAAVPAVGFLAMAKIALGRPVARSDDAPEVPAEVVQQEEDAGRHAGPAGPEPEDQQDRAQVEPYTEAPVDPRTEWDRLLWVGLAVVADLEQSGVSLTRTSLVNGLRARQVALSTDRATRLLRDLRGLSRADLDRLHNTVQWEEAAR